jgi:DNA-binding NarL/FixJ family response regulator
MLNGLALRDGFEGAPKVRKNRFKCNENAVKSRTTIDKYRGRIRALSAARQLTNGKCNKEIGCVLNISEATVKVHITHILEKLKVTGRTEAINVAVKRGLVHMDSAAVA